MVAAMPWPMPATTHGHYRPGSATRTSSTRCVTPNLRRIDLRTSGDNRRSLRHVEGPRRIAKLEFLIVQRYRCHASSLEIYGGGTTVGGSGSPKGDGPRRVVSWDEVRRINSEDG